MQYHFMFNETEILTIHAALEHAVVWAGGELLNEKSIDKLESYIRDEVEMQTKTETSTLIAQLRK